MAAAPIRKAASPARRTPRVAPVQGPDNEVWDRAPIAHLTLDARGTVRNANRAATALLGVGKDGLVGGRFGRFVHRTSRAVWKELLAGSIRGATHETTRLTQIGRAHV